MRLVIIESPYAGGGDDNLRLERSGTPHHKCRAIVGADGSGPVAYGATADEAVRNARILRNVRYARRALLDSLERGEAPYASHLLYTQVLDDSTPEQRQHGLEAGWAWQSVVDAVVVYTDLGISAGMQAAIDSAKCPVEYRSIGR